MELKKHEIVLNRNLSFFCNVNGIHKNQHQLQGNMDLCVTPNSSNELWKQISKGLEINNNDRVLLLPKPIKYEIIEEPPYETSGKVKPTTGNTPMTIDILIIETKKKFEIIP